MLCFRATAHPTAAPCCTCAPCRSMFLPAHQAVTVPCRTLAHDAIRSACRHGRAEPSLVRGLLATHPATPATHPHMPPFAALRTRTPALDREPVALLRLAAAMTEATSS